MRQYIVEKSKKSPLVVQSNKLIESRYSLTVGEQRLIFAMTSMIHPDDADFFPYEIKIIDLAKILNIDLKNAYREADKITDRLMERVLRIPQENGDLLKIGWVSSCRYHKKNSSISFKFDPDLKPYLLRLQKEFTQSRLTILRQFKSIYAIRIYQLLRQYKKIGFRIFQVDELKDILGIKKEKYREFKRFRSRVLNQAKKEFDRKSKSGNYQCDLTFKLETIKDGRRIKGVKFIIIPQAYQEQLPFFDNPPEEAEKNSLKERLKFYGISGKQADQFLKELKEEDIEDILEYYAERLEAGKIQSKKGAYLVKLLEENIVVKTPYEKQKEKAEEEKKKIIEKQKVEADKVQKKREQERENKRKELTQKFQELSELEKNKILDNFEKSLSPIIRKSFIQNGKNWDTVQYRGVFYEFLSKEFI